MKITVNIDCTPQEAREFLGLPNIQPMQEKAMKQIDQGRVAVYKRHARGGFAREGIRASSSLTLCREFEGSDLSRGGYIASARLGALD